jgi:tRNA threonylcarbamoyladenosine biosynthesis protein TsaB
MRIVAIETSGLAGSIAALEAKSSGVRTLAERILPTQPRTARTLLPALRELLTEVGWRPGDVESYCVAKGPGSFTGLRIGVVAAKTLAYAAGAKLSAVGTLDVIARQVREWLSSSQSSNDAGRVWSILDAQRGDLFVGRDEATGDAHAELLPVDGWLALLRPGDVVAGPPLEKLAARLPAGVVVAAAETWAPLAATVGKLGYERLLQLGHIDPIQLVPDYGRRSAAEEKAG